MQEERTSRVIARFEPLGQARRVLGAAQQRIGVVLERRHSLAIICRTQCHKKQETIEIQKTSGERSAEKDKWEHKISNGRNPLRLPQPKRGGEKERERGGGRERERIRETQE